jgi:DNA topoisomerase-1
MKEEYSEKIEKMPEESENLKEKIYKNRKEKANEERREYIPITRPKQTVEITVKPKPTRSQIEIIEKPKKENSEKIIEEKISHIKKAKRTVVEKVKTKKIESLKGNSILIITEKPQAASKIASALSDGKEEKHSDNGVPYYEFTKDNQRIIIACAVGHLFSLSQDEKGSNYPIFNVSWKPNFEVRKKDFTKKYYQNLLKLIKRSKEIIVATDYDTEGEVIGYNIIRFIANQKDAKRMKYSSLTKDELEEAYKNTSPTIDWGQAIAGETRHFIDWYYGINLSRALMNSIKTTGKFRIMSVGRVQGPALKLIVDKEREIKKFKPIPYWKIFIEVRDQKDKTNILRLRHIKDIFNEKQLEVFEKLKNQVAEMLTEKKQQTIQPPAPFDLTSLQTEAYRLYGFNPARTLQIAQELYLAGIISYPRTSSQKIPLAINPKNILKKLAKIFPEVKNASRQIPIEGKKSDPAHPSITPTGEISDLEGEAKKLYEIIARRFISCFSQDAIIENKIITATANNLIFKEKGAEIKTAGWMDVYPASIQEKEIRDMNGKADITKVDIEKDETKPPKRFSPASIISELEKRGLGTKATRANILETLYDRNYITDQKSIRATPLGINLIETLEKHSPIIIDEKLTKNMEKDMDGIRTGKKDLEKKEEDILSKAKTTLTKISEDFHKKEGEIGKELLEAEKDYWQQQNKENELALCPACKKGMLTIKFSPKNKKFFVACNAYPACKTTFSLPPYGVIKNLNKQCDKCGFPLLMSLRKGKKPWIFCFNPNCPSRQQGAAQPAQEENSQESSSESDSKEQIN